MKPSLNWLLVLLPVAAVLDRMDGVAP